MSRCRPALPRNRRLGPVMLAIVLPVAAACDTGTPLERLQAQLEPFPEYSVVLQDMDEDLFGYSHRYRVVVGQPQAGSDELDYREAVLDWQSVDSATYERHRPSLGMVVLSKHEIDSAAVRTFRALRWKDMPGARLPVRPDGSSFYSEDALAILRLSSKSHWDVPIRIDGEVVHLLASHPTPPVFDGPEDRNGLRNADEIRFWKDYIEGADYIRDDAGRPGGLPRGAQFVIAGDLNSDPMDGDSAPGAARQLLEHPLVNTSVTPASDGAAAAAAAQGGANVRQRGDPRFDTADFRDRAPGNLRVDYVLPSAGLEITDAGVFWPAEGEPGAALIDASDHRPVWIDVIVCGFRIDGAVRSHPGCLQSAPEQLRRY